MIMRFEMGLVGGLAFVALGAMGCSSSSSGASSDGGPGADAPVEGAVVDDGGGQPPVSDGGPASGDDGGDGGPTVCNTLVNAGQAVTAVRMADLAPAFQGGAVVDGTYVLTAETQYTGDGGATGTGGSQSITIRIQGSLFQVAKDSNPPTSTYAFAPTGTTYTATGQCPPTLGDIVGSYTATSTTFVASLAAPGGDGGPPVTVETFTKQ
jgi:hypothetical protein